MPKRPACQPMSCRSLGNVLGLTNSLPRASANRDKYSHVNCLIKRAKKSTRDGWTPRYLHEQLLVTLRVLKRQHYLSKAVAPSGPVFPLSRQPSPQPRVGCSCFLPPFILHSSSSLPACPVVQTPKCNAALNYSRYNTNSNSIQFLTFAPLFNRPSSSTSF